MGDFWHAMWHHVIGLLKMRVIISGVEKIWAYSSPFQLCTSFQGQRKEVYGNGKIYDITHRISSETPIGISEEGIGEYLTLYARMKNGSLLNFSLIKLPDHVGTHVDAPGHIFESYFDAGFNVDSLDLDVLNAEDMKSLNIPKGVRRVLFRTLNTDRRLMCEKKIDTSFVGFMKDGAQWLKDYTDIKFVGIDYLAVAAFDDNVPAHLVLLESRIRHTLTHKS